MPFGDNVDGAVNHSYGGLVVNRVRRDWHPGSPSFYVRHGGILMNRVRVIEVYAHREVDLSERPLTFQRHLAARGNKAQVGFCVDVVGVITMLPALHPT